MISPSCKREWMAAHDSTRVALMMKKLKNEPAKMFENYEDVPKGLRMKLIYNKGMTVKDGLPFIAKLIDNQNIITELAKDFRICCMEVNEYVFSLLPEVLSGEIPTEADLVNSINSITNKHFPDPEGVGSAVGKRILAIFPEDMAKLAEEAGATGEEFDDVEKELDSPVAFILRSLKKELMADSVFSQTGEMSDHHYQRLADFIRVTDSHSGLELLTGLSTTFHKLEQEMLPKMLKELEGADKYNATVNKTFAAIQQAINDGGNPTASVMAKLMLDQLKEVFTVQGGLYKMLREDVTFATGCSARFSLAIDDTLTFSKHYKHYNECLDAFIKSAK